MASEDAATPWAVTGTRGSDRVLLLTTPGLEGQQITDWLNTSTAFEVLTELGHETDPDYDLVIADRDALDRHQDQLRTHVEAVQPTFLPVLLMRSDGETESQLPASIAALIDDVIEHPVEKIGLARRIETLLKTRRQSRRLRERERQYELLIESMPEPILLVRAGRIVSGNAAAKDMFVVGDDDQFVGRQFMSLVRADHRRNAAEVIDEIERTGSVSEYTTCRFEALDGSQPVGDVAGVEIVYEDEPTTQLLVRDVTADHVRQHRLNLFGRAIDAAAQGVTIADAQSEDEPLIYANAAFERITGYDVAEVMGRNCRFLQGPNTEESTVATLRAAIAAREPTTVEIRNYRKDGTPFWNELEIVPIEGPEGTVTHFLGLQQDVTVRKEREEQLAVMSRVLRHNMRNRVNVIKGRAEQVADADLGNQIEAAADELLELSERFRQFSTLSSTGENLLEVVDVSAGLGAIVGDLRGAYPEATLSTEYPEGLSVYSHPLVLSALDGFLNRTLTVDADATLELVAGQRGGTVAVELRDHGRTVSRSALEAVAAGVESAIDHPRGVDLWLLRWVVQRSGGEFAVRSAEGSPTIRFELPSCAGTSRNDQARDSNEYR